MDKQTQVELLDELVQLHQRKSPFLDEHWVRVDCERYRSEVVFARERERIHRGLPQIAAHVSALPGPGSFATVEVVGAPLLLTRDAEGRARAFHNICRHRGAQLVPEASGCKHRFSCPYHAWTWSNTGDLIAVPHEKSGFPGLNRADHGLHAVPCVEHAGWVWVDLAEGAERVDVPAHLGGMAADMEALAARDHVVFDSVTLDIAANWKLLVEGGLEAYHFRVAHRDTIAPLFLDNLSSYRCFGPHIRSILPRSTLPELADRPAGDWLLGEHANVLYSVFATAQFLVQEDHFIWIQSHPLDAGHTRLVLSTMIPRADNTPERQGYWKKNHALTVKTLIEDFDLAEGIQRGLRGGANRQLNFGRFEGALAAFNQSVDAAIA
ncbi:aromatic ring-hydroxylating oxygenase subunit alpha [Parahaliea mediterranea]|uniref:Rieske 2Fe-2S domain-containing protein n=1 Tax=Parahaliea mediterranea TaxID=651086 RepID=A0A939IP24_9GAMM|nr:SRPBCC family protein [Parahaliea mediterranea]MBN7798632.1 Rieske 2Fe-2S domain-containing protein [Parahaliea mediterranea]